MTLRDLAKHLGISIATASRALNPATAERVASPLRARILAYAEKMNYRPDPVAQHLARGRTHTIGVILYSAFRSHFFTEYLATVQWGIATALEYFPSYGCKTLLLPRGRPATEADKHVIGSSVDGILLSGVRDFNIEQRQHLLELFGRRWRKPVVALNFDVPPRSSISTVTFSNKEATYRAMTHLIQTGRRHIGLIYNRDGAPDVMDRISVYEKVLNDHRLSPSTENRAPGNASIESGYRAAIDLLTRPGNTRMDAIFCMNDEMAFGALKAIAALGKRCPQDVAVMGFDGLIAGELTTPRLTTVLQPFHDIAKSGMELLINLIEGRQKGPVHLEVPTQLIIRDSA